MSHEIRTPLNAVVGFSECILTADDLGEAKENAADIVNASQTLLEIVNGILDISKIEAGKMEIINTDYNAVEMFENIRRLSKARLGDKELELRFHIAEDLPKVLYGDHANLKKVIINLVTNAIKYTERGYVDFKVSCIFNSGVCRLIVTVEDSGRGIKKDQVDKLFTKFQRLDEDRNTTIEGTGLGLAITKKIIELMGGQIVVQSVYGRGSRFTIAIDQRVSEVKESELEKKEVVEKKEIDFSSKKILVVDDNKLNLKVATKVLSDYKVIIETCESGYECIERIEAGEVYDLILLDDMMPRMSGVETLSKLRGMEKFNIPTVALTANAITGMREKYLQDGFIDYLAKPIEKEELDRVLNSYLRESEELEEITKELKNIISEQKRILIVDDNKLNIVVASKFLKPYNFNIESVTSGQECIERIKSGARYDLIFMDDMMPVIDGVTTYHELQKLEGFSIPVVALTANAMEGSREHYLSEGFNEYMSKPIDKNELNRIINLFVLNN
jgi:Signal transduction histidine kinase